MTNEKMGLTKKDFDSMSNEYVVKLMKIMMAKENETVEDLTIPHIRSTVKNLYPLFIVMYGILVIVGTLMNCGMIYHITRHKLYKDSTYAFLVNIAISDLIKCIFVLPITLAILLIENWIFGKFLCYFVPILQDIPIHVSIMTYLLIAGDRYRLLSDPGRPRIPAFVCAVGAWFFAVCIVLPHPIYTTYLDLEIYKKVHFRGLGICMTNLSDNIEQYMRGLFLLTYVAPLTITAYLYVKSSRELQNQEGPLAVAMYEARTKDSNSRHGSNNSNEFPSIRSGERGIDSPRTSATTVGLSGISRTHDLYDAELDVCKEKRTQKYLISMISTFAVLFCPLMVLKLAKLSVVETNENIGPLDITFTLFVWLGFLSTITTPVFYIAWQMSRSAKERLRANLLSCNRRLSRVSEDVTEMTNEQVTRNNSGVENVTYGTNGRVENLYVCVTRNNSVVENVAHGTKARVENLSSERNGNSRVSRSSLTQPLSI